MVTVKIGGEDYSQYAVLPVKWSALLDERLDEATLELKPVPVRIFTPMTEVTVESDAADLYCVVANDESIETPPGSGVYFHTLTLVEATKKLEREPCETLAFQNNLGRTYTGNPLPAEPVYE